MEINKNLIKQNLVNGLKIYLRRKNISVGLDYNSLFTNNSTIDSYVDEICDLSDSSIISSWHDGVYFRKILGVYDEGKNLTFDEAIDDEMIETYYRDAGQYYSRDSRERSSAKDIIMTFIEDCYQAVFMDVCKAELLFRKDDNLLKSSIELVAYSGLDGSIYPDIDLIKKLKDVNINTLGDLVSHTRKEIADIIYIAYSGNSKLDSLARKLLDSNINIACSFGYEYPQKFKTICDYMNGLGLKFAEETVLEDKKI